MHHVCDRLGGGGLARRGRFMTPRVLQQLARALVRVTYLLPPNCAQRLHFNQVAVLHSHCVSYYRLKMADVLLGMRRLEQPVARTQDFSTCPHCSACQAETGCSHWRLGTCSIKSTTDGSHAAAVDDDDDDWRGAEGDGLGAPSCRFATGRFGREEPPQWWMNRAIHPVWPSTIVE